MGLFDFTKKGGKKAKESSKKKKESAERFEAGSNGLVFNAKIQIIASPKKYATEIATNYVEAIRQSRDAKQNKNYHIVRVDVSKPDKLKEEQKMDEQEKNVDLFKILIDMDVGVKDKSKVFDFCFDFMPFSIEVTEPMNLGFSAADFTEYVTSVLATLHKIDDNLKKTSAANKILYKQNQNLVKNMVRMLRNNVLLSLREKSKDIDELAKNIGIDVANLKPFLDNMVSEKEIGMKKDKYMVSK